MTVNSLIEATEGNALTNIISSTLMEIDQNYHPGTLSWLKKSRPREWREMIALEAEIDQAALSNEKTKLQKALKSYQDLISSAVTAFRIPKGDTGNLFGK